MKFPIDRQVVFRQGWSIPNSGTHEMLLKNAWIHPEQFRPLSPRRLHEDDSRTPNEDHP